MLKRSTVQRWGGGSFFIVWPDIVLPTTNFSHTRRSTHTSHCLSVCRRRRLAVRRRIEGQPDVRAGRGRGQDRRQQRRRREDHGGGGGGGAAAAAGQQYVLASLAPVVPN